ATGGLHHCRGTSGPHYLGHRIPHDLTRAKIGMPIRPGVEGIPGVVGVHQVDPPGDGPHLLHDLTQVDPTGVGVTGVQAEADGVATLDAADRLPEPVDRLQPAGHGVVTAGGVLDEHRDGHVQTVDALAPVVEPG